MKINKITIQHVKGIEQLEIEHPLVANRPNISVAPNGFGKSSIATAFSSVKPNKLELTPDDCYNQDQRLPSSISILLDDNQTLTANSSSNTIKNVFAVHVVNCQLKPKAFAVIQHIAYHKLDKTYDTDIFTEATIKGKLGINAIESAKSLYDLVVLDSMGVEKRFAESLEVADEVVVYTKLPNGFYINTPVGHYNPDWAIAFKEGSVKHVSFVAETKGAPGYLKGHLRGTEDAKIECARRHFASISDSEVIYDVVETYGELRDIITK